MTHDQAPDLILYSRPDCQLCDEAEQMLENAGLAWQPVDIETRLDLIRAYGTRIPVIYRPDVERALYWPFTETALLEFVDGEI